MAVVACGLGDVEVLALVVVAVLVDDGQKCGVGRSVIEFKGNTVEMYAVPNLSGFIDISLLELCARIHGRWLKHTEVSLYGVPAVEVQQVLAGILLGSSGIVLAHIDGVVLGFLWCEDDARVCFFGHGSSFLAGLGLYNEVDGLVVAFGTFRNNIEVVGVCGFSRCHLGSLTVVGVGNDAHLVVAVHVAELAVIPYLLAVAVVGIAQTHFQVGVERALLVAQRFILE